MLYQILLLSSTSNQIYKRVEGKEEGGVGSNKKIIGSYEHERAGER